MTPTETFDFSVKEMNERLFPNRKVIVLIITPKYSENMNLRCWRVEIIDEIVNDITKRKTAKRLRTERYEDRKISR